MYVKATTTQENLKTTQLRMVVAQLRATLFGIKYDNKYCHGDAYTQDLLHLKNINTFTMQKK